MRARNWSDSSALARKVETSLRKVPGDDVLRPLLGELNSVHHELGEVSKEVRLLDEEIQAAETNAGHAKQASTKAYRGAHGPSQAGLEDPACSTVQRVLEEYRTALIGRKISQLERTFMDCFQRLHRKDDVLTRVSISPKTFSATLFDKREHAIPKAELSAGEKQIYAISMLWALASTSGRPLPVIIDTPLGRLDSDHRRLLVERYFPHASHQVIILSTDTEVDQRLFQQLQPHIARAYRLDFDSREGCTKVKSGYFWEGEEVDECQQA